MRLIVSFTLLTIFFTTRAETFVYFQNNTTIDFTVNTVQSGTHMLDSDEWGNTAGNLDAWQRETEIFWSNRNEGIHNGDNFFFDASLISNTDTFYIKMQLDGNFIGSDMSYAASGNSFSNPWFTDNSYHQNTFTIDGKTVILKFSSFFTGGYDDLKFTLQEVDPYPMDVSLLNDPNSLNIFAYNIYMLSPPISLTEQGTRAQYIHDHIHDYDAIIFSEAFDNSARENHLIPSIDTEYPYYTAVVDESGSLEDGGVFIASRWPIEVSDMIVYTDCDGSDCLAAKGAMYARINKMGKIYHLFGTHTQAFNDNDNVFTRISQFQELNSFIASKNIPQSEAVIIGGDLNVDKVVNNLNEYNGMLDSLDMIEPSYLGHPYTYDGDLSYYTEAGYFEYLDYVVAINSHFSPVTLINAPKILRTIVDDLFEIYDLSDHFGVHGQFYFPAILTQPVTVNSYCVGESVNLSVGTNVDTLLSFQWQKDGVDLSNETSTNLEIISAGIQDNGAYHCIVSHTNGILYSDTVILQVVEGPLLNGLSDTIICDGESINLIGWVEDDNNTVGDFSYWADAQQTISLVAFGNVQESGTYYIKKETDSGCFDVFEVTLGINPIPNTPVIAYDNNSLASTVEYDTYQWYLDGNEVSGVSGQSYTPIANGVYTLLVSANECYAALSNSIVVNDIDTSILALHHTNDFGFKLYPNPIINGVLTITSTVEINKVIIYSILGEKLVEYSYGNLSANRLIDLSTLTAGHYILQLQNGERQESAVQLLRKE